MADFGPGSRAMSNPPKYVSIKVICISISFMLSGVTASRRVYFDRPGVNNYQPGNFFFGRQPVSPWAPPNPNPDHHADMAHGGHLGQHTHMSSTEQRYIQRKYCLTDHVFNEQFKLEPRIIESSRLSDFTGCIFAYMSYILEGDGGKETVIPRHCCKFDVFRFLRVCRQEPVTSTPRPTSPSTSGQPTKPSQKPSSAPPTTTKTPHPTTGTTQSTPGSTTKKLATTSATSTKPTIKNVPRAEKSTKRSSHTTRRKVFDNEESDN